MQNWLVSILIALVLSTAASAEKFTLEVVDLGNARSCYEGYALKVSGLPEGTNVVDFILRQGDTPCVKASFEFAISKDKIIQISETPIRQLNCRVRNYEWIAQAKPTYGSVPKSLGTARALFQNPQKHIELIRNLDPADRWRGECW